MATLDNVNLFAVGGATDDTQDPLYPEYLELVKRFEEIKQGPTIPGGYPDAPSFASFKKDKQNELARQTLATELEANNIKKSYEEGFTQLPIGEQLLYYINPVTGVPIETYETGYFTKEGGLGVKTPKEMLVDAIDPRKNIFQKSFLKAEDPVSAAIAPLSALGALGGIGELANIPKAGLMALRRFQQKTMDGGGGGIGELPPTTLDEDVNKFARDGDFVSPTIEALIRNAPKNIKGKQIIEYLNSKGAPSAGIKPKELPYLDIERFIEENPNATLPEVIEHAGKNKVQVGEVVYKDIGTDGSDFYFERSTPELDPIDPSYNNNEYMVDLVRDEIDTYGEDLVNLYNAYRTQKYNRTNSEAGIPPKINDYSEITDEGLAMLDIDRDTLIETLGDELYKDNPYILIEPAGEGFQGGDKTFAFGNDDVGYQTFINGERIKMSDYGYDDVAYSANEAEIRLQRILEEREDIDIGMYLGDQKFKTYVDTTLPGGKNYSEKVYTFDNADEGLPSEMSHFDEDTQIAHKLGRDRILEDGTVSVHADEIQSDLHKEGRKYGYTDPEQDKEIRLNLISQNKTSFALHKKIVERMRKELDEIKELAAKHPELNDYLGELDYGDKDLAVRKLSGEDQGQIVFATNQDTEIFLDHLRKKYGDSPTINNFRVPSRIQVLDRNVQKIEKDLAEWRDVVLPKLDDVKTYTGRQVPPMAQTTINIKDGTPESVTTVLKEFKKAVNKPNYANKIKKIQELEVESSKINQKLAENFLQDLAKFSQQYPDADLSDVMRFVNMAKENKLTGGIVDLAYKSLQKAELNNLTARANRDLDVFSDPRNVDITNPALSRLLDADLNFREMPPEAMEQINKVKNNRQAINKLRDDTTIDLENFMEVQDYVSDDFIELQNLDKIITDKNRNFMSMVPNFPFKGDDYGEMVLKKMILDAINEGKDAISVSASRPILERYNMTPGSDEAQFFERFYDSTLPKSMDKLAKKYGGEFERGSLDLKDTFGEPSRLPLTKAEDSPEAIGLGFLEEREPQRFYDTIEIASAKANILRITPEMKAKIIKEGLPLFYMGGKVSKSNSMDKPIEGNRREM